MSNKKKDEFIIMRVPKKLKKKIVDKSIQQKVTVSRVGRDILGDNIDAYEADTSEEKE